MSYYEIQERSKQGNVLEHRVFDISGPNRTNIGWVDLVSGYAPHVYIADIHHVLNKREMYNAIVDSGISDSGTFFRISEMVTLGDINATQDLKEHIERLTEEIREMQEDADRFLEWRKEKLQGIKDIQKQTDEIIKKIQSNENNLTNKEGQ